MNFLFVSLWYFVKHEDTDEFFVKNESSTSILSNGYFSDRLFPQTGIHLRIWIECTGTGLWSDIKKR